MTGNLYARFDVAMCRDPRMIEAGPAARMLYVQAVMYAKENLTDGLINARVLHLVAIDLRNPRQLMSKLCQVGAMEEVEDGWQIPETVWRKWNPTRDEVEETRAQKREAGIIGNHKRWHTADDPNVKCVLCQEAGWVRTRRTTIAPCDRTGIAPVSPETKTETKTETSSAILPTRSTEPVDNPADDDEDETFIGHVIERITHNRTHHHTGIKNPTAYKAKTRQAVRTEHTTQILELHHQYPNAPHDVIAAAIDGETRTLTHYQTG